MNKSVRLFVGLRRCSEMLGAALVVGFFAIFAGIARPVRSADDVFNLGFADYRNNWYTSGPAAIPGIEDYAATSTIVFHGSVGPYAAPLSGDTPTTPTDGTSYTLVRSAFGQPVGGRTFFHPDFLLGEEIVPPKGDVAVPLDHVPVIDPPTHAFYVPTARKVFAGDYGLVDVTWRRKNGTSWTIQYLISNRTIQDPVRIYHTEQDKGGLVDLSGAPTATIHYNDEVKDSSQLWIDPADTTLHAKDASGLVVMHYDDGTSFAGIEIVDVRPYIADYQTTGVFVGTVLTPRETRPDMLSAPTVSHGDEGPKPYIYQYGDDKSPTVAGQVFSVRPTSADDQIILYWKHRGRFPGVEWPYELHIYETIWDPATDWQRIYYTADGTLGPTVDVAGVDIIQFFYNDEITTEGTIFVNSNPREIRATDAGGLNETGKILMRMDDLASTGWSVLEFVEVRHYYPDYVTPVNVGDQLLPARSVANPLQEETVVRRGWNGNQMDPANYAYQHMVAGSYKGAVFAVRPTTEANQIEVFFRRRGKKQLIWPYEMHRYTADWPPNTQLYVRGTSADVPGPTVAIPEDLHAALMPYQEFIPADGGPREQVNHSTLNNDRFFSDIATKPRGDYYALLRYQTGPRTSPGSEWVGFEPVRCVAHNDTRLFDLAPHAWAIGTEITDPYHEGPQPGYIYHVPGEDHWDKYDPRIYNEGGTGYETGQIFPVFPGILEVWWSNVTTHGLAADHSYAVQWPSLVKRYSCNWPADPEVMVIASEIGSGQIPDNQKNPEIYYQNDPNKVGYNPNYEHARLFPLDSGVAAFALRCDLNQESNDKPYPYVLLKYRDADDNNLWRYRVFRVVAEDDTYKFHYDAEAGSLIRIPYPLAALPEASETTPGLHNGTYPVSGPYWQDRNLSFWARAASDDGGTTEIVMRYWYPVQEGFVFPKDSDNQLYPVGARTPWLNKLSAPTDTPVDVHYTVHWPDDIPVLKAGETLVVPKFGLPDIMGQCSVEVIYESLNHSNPHVSIPGRQNAILIDPIRKREVELAALPTGADAIDTENIGGLLYFVQLPPHLRDRISYDPINHKLAIVGDFFELLGEDIVLPNVLSERDKKFLYDLSADSDFRNAVDDLYELTSSPVVLTPSDSNSAGKALVGVTGAGGGYVTLAMQNHDSCRPLPVSLEIIRVEDNLYTGEIKVIEPKCVFDEKLTLRHSGDFAGKAQQYVFQWEYHPDQDGTQPSSNSALWTPYPTDPDNGLGALDITIQGPGIFTLSDNWFRCRYRRATDPDDDRYYSNWTPPQLAPGWIKRVIGRINPFTQRATGGGIQGAEERFSSFQTREVNTIVSMISQAGPRWEGSVPLNCGPGLDDLGLIEIYETVFHRGMELSVDAGYRYPPANNSLLLAAGRIADLYMLLGNEAYADAADPTIAFGTEDGTYGNEACSIHCFMNQTDSLLEEELALLRGRDDSKAPGVRVAPLYNRLMWNFTKDMNGGEVAYALNYNIRDEEGHVDGTIDEKDAMALYPQGHGDAWGHYLTAIKRYYTLLRHPNFDWKPRSEAVLVGGQPVTVDYLDERKFAKAAAAKARTGAEIVNLTYREAYVEDPSGQWQGYKDSDPDRAWGFAQWASRAGQGAYFDWVVANAILPDKDTEHTGIQKIDRTTVPELREIVAAFERIQQEVDEADIGLNPLGLAKNVVPFDIDPRKVDEGETHFEQIYERALTALQNAVTVFNHAINSTQLLRRQADSLDEFQQDVDEREADFKNRLIEIFGYPYEGDIGEGKTYPQGYDGPDIYHYDYVDVSELLGSGDLPTKTFRMKFYDYGEVDDEGNVTSKMVTVTYNISTDGFGMVVPKGWGRRRAPGEIQIARSNLIQLYGQFEQLRAEYSNLVQQIQSLSDQIDERCRLKSDKLEILRKKRNAIAAFNAIKIAAHEVELGARRLAEATKSTARSVIESLPKNTILGLAAGGDLTAPARGAVRTIANSMAIAATITADIAEATQESMDLAKETVEQNAEIDIVDKEGSYEIKEMVRELANLVREEQAKRLELHTQAEAIMQAMGEYQAALARGLRLLEERTRFRVRTASKVQDYRYKDMAFRIFRDDALQKYRAQFDLAARYVYLAAKAYDYETNLLDRDNRAGEYFLTTIVRARSLGNVIDGVPQTAGGVGDPGLADAMARMKLNWDLVLKGQLGFNNPQTETNRFSLRRELFRCVSDDRWREVLRRHRVDDLLTYREFKRYCRVFHPHQDVEPGIVIPIPTTINFGFNFFGRELAAGDSAYDSTNFATKIRSVGVWFTGYDALTSQGLSNTPRVYLIPVGYDIMRSPTGESGEIRIWKILDQKLPVPFPIGQRDLADPEWIPMVDTLSEEYAAIRKFSSFRAYHDSGDFDESEMTYDSRLIGRSVWNTRWLLIIPAGTLSADREKGLETFINGVTDIKLFFQTYAYSGD